MNKKILLLVLSIAFLIAISTLLIIATTSPIKKMEFTVSNPTAQIPEQKKWTLLEKIEEGKQLLKASEPLKYEERGNKVVRQEISLAVLNVRTGEVFEKRYWLAQDEMKKARSIRRNYLENKDSLPHFVSENTEETFVVTTRWWNTFNSDLAISNSTNPNHGYIITSNKYLWKNSNIFYDSDKTSDGKYSDIIYVPYSPSLHIKELVYEGKNFLDDLIKQAFETLKERGVMSRVSPSEFVSSTLEQSFVKNILLVEHTDPSLFFDSKDNGRWLTERIFIRLATNKEKAFRYTESKVGALGIAQIMPRTYSYPRKKTGIVERYPKARLIKDQDLGRVELLNSVMASILVFDDHLAGVFRNMSKAQKNKLDQKLVENPDFINEIRAAIYNGGSSKYRRSTATISLSNKETRGFLEKYRNIRDLKLFD